MTKSILGAAVAALTIAAPLAAQTTGPTFNAPYRAFTRHAFGGTIAFPEGGGGTIVEGQFRFGYRTFDIGVRGGLQFPDFGDELLLLGLEARNRVITHSVSFPLDGALIFGLGMASNGGTNFNVPVGLSLGRRLEVSGSDVSIVPYVQPTGFILIPDGGDASFEIGIGVGGDFRLSNAFDARISIGFGNGPEGVSISAVWVR